MFQNILNQSWYKFPNARKKALIMSFDDGSEHDRRLVSILDQYGIRGTFHLNASRVGSDYFIRRDEIRTLYRNHEISSHTEHHPDLTHLADDEVRMEISRDVQALENLAGYPIRGMAYPFGQYDDRVVSLVSELGLVYARTINDTYDFKLPDDFLRLTTTCHHNRADELGERLLSSEESGLELMVVWGHSYELDGFMSSDPGKDWAYMEAFCRRMQASSLIWFATIIDVIDYLQAIRLVDAASTDACVSNPSALSTWINVDGKDIEIPPGGSVDLTRASP